MEYEAPPKSRVEIRFLANRLRDFLGIQEVVYVDIVQLIERLHLNDENFSIVVVEDGELDGKYAETIPELNRIIVSNSTYLGALNGNKRDRFTLAHELGHYLLHDDVTIKLARMSHEIENDTPHYCRVEWQANTFAAEFLVSKDLVKGMTPDEISVKCGVSLEVAEIQFYEYEK